MTKHTFTRATLLVFVFFLQAFGADHYIVRLNPASANAVASQFGQYGATVVKMLKGSGTGLYVLSVPTGPVGSVILQNLKQNPLVQAVEPDTAIRVPSVPRSALPPKTPALVQPTSKSLYYQAPAWNSYTGQPATLIINLKQAQAYATGKGALVATIDTAVYPHYVLAGSLVPGYDFMVNQPGGFMLDQETTPILDQKSDVYQETTPILDGDDTVVLTQETTPILDDYQETTPILDQETTPILDQNLPPEFGHGTMVAGVIHLVAPNAKIMPLKVFDDSGNGSLSDVIDAIYYAIDHGVDVINMSFSASDGSSELQKAITAATAKGVVILASAGNNGQQVNVFPASYKPVVGVGSITNQDTLSAFSNSGTDVEIAAPGEAIISTYPRNRYAAGWGTSFSTPMLAGAAAMLVELNRVHDPNQVANALTNGMPAIQNASNLGFGYLDLVKVVR